MKVIIPALGIIFIVFGLIAQTKKRKIVYADKVKDRNKFQGKKVIFVEDDNEAENADGKKGHLEEVGNIKYKPSFYEKYVKRSLDILLSFSGLVVLAPIFGIITLAVKINDPGPVIFSQKRVGKNKEYFQLHKFRTMKMSTPHDTPTHMLSNPDQYITKIGKFLRKHSLDELPQIWDIFIGNMSVVGPRPALWNQDVLIAERDKYGANNIKPGLTGWAQINGRDELELVDKAKLDGEYLQKLTFGMDMRCFFRTIRRIGHDDSIVEGGNKVSHREIPKKILFLANHYITLYSFRRELIEKLLKNGYDVYISLPDMPDNKFFEEQGCKIIITHVDRRGMNPFNDLKLLLFYKRIFKKINPDIIFSYTIKPNIYGTLASNGRYKQICNITGTGEIFLEKNILNALCKMLYKISVKKCYKVFFQNKGDRDLFVANSMVGRNYEILPGSGCNLEEYQYEPMPQGDTIRFIFIGRVMKVKGIDEYLEAAKIIKGIYPNTAFLIAGWAEEKKYQEIIANYQKKGIVKYVGFQKDIKEWIRKCHCTVLPSHGGEGVPNAMLESGAMGRACIGSKINGIVDLIEDGVTGYLFDMGDIHGLTEKLKKFIQLSEQEKQVMGKEGRKKVEREYDRKIVIEKYCNEI